MTNDPRRPDQASTERRPRWFYGWTIVGVASVISFAGAVETNPILGVFQGPITDYFGWSRGLFTLPMSIGTFSGGVAAIFIGPLMDRYGPRWIMSIAVIVMGLLFFGMGVMNAYWQYFIIQVFGRTLVASTFFLIVGVAIPKWFIAKRGRAIGVAALGQRFGHAMYPLIIGGILVFGDWRAAALALGASVWLFGLLPAALLLRRRPEDMGLLPDNAKPDLRTIEAVSDKPKQTTEISFSRKQALRSPAFYLLLSALTIQSFVATGVNFHQYSYLTGNGVSESVALTALAVSPLVGMPVSIMAGFLIERIPANYVLAAAYVLTSLAIAVFLAADNPLFTMIFAVLYGSGLGVFVTNNQIIWADFFGRSAIGGIRGIVSPVQMFTNALGPWVAALTYDATGSYRSRRT